MSALLSPAAGLRQVSPFWFETRDGDAAARALFHRHYSYRAYADGRAPLLFVGPGEKMVLLTAEADALFVWRRFICGDGQEGLNCAVFRNESGLRGSVLILSAESAAEVRWGKRRLFTYINPRKVRSVNPGCCFRKAGWRRCGVTKHRKLLIMEKSAAAIPQSAIRNPQ